MFKTKKINLQILFTSFLIIGLLIIYKNIKINNNDNIKLKEIPNSFKVYGIDVSHYQKKINWDFFKKNDSLIKFVYCKATEGINFIDPQWKNNRLKLIELNIKNGAYHFFNPKLDPIKQANHFLANYTYKKNDLPPVLDSEIEIEPTEKLIKNIKLWLIHIEKTTNQRPIIYTSYYLYKKILKKHFKEYKFWIANYSKTPNRVIDKNIIFWQYSDEGKIAGISGNVDLNISKIDFN
ncbi:MAG: hypothetical protein CL844_02775 [Crocinitomicaceae bacterium]|nr:hypothetical protein [Crocinitomicaceae bacterium]|tara:strand:- start:18810 stop:19517 length:708 start_codon:yes stop_codon:yes gene_type:complete